MSPEFQLLCVVISIFTLWLCACLLVWMWVSAAGDADRRRDALEQAYRDLEQHRHDR